MSTPTQRRSRRMAVAVVTGKLIMWTVNPKAINLTRTRGSYADEIMDEDFTFTNARRRSNSSSFSHSARDFKTKFEINDPEPVFEESIHGPLMEEDENGDNLSKTDSSESGHSAE